MPLNSNLNISSSHTAPEVSNLPNDNKASAQPNSKSLSNRKVSAQPDSPSKTASAMAKLSNVLADNNVGVLRKSTASNAVTKKKAEKEVRRSALVRPNDLSLEEWQVALRRQVAKKDQFSVEPLKEADKQGYYIVKKPLFAKITLKSKKGEKPAFLGYGTPYTVVYRGENSKWNYCSCMDFKTSGLGTCKHIEAVKAWGESNGKKLTIAKLPRKSSVYIDYSDGRKIKIRIGAEDREIITDIAKEYFDAEGVFTGADPYDFYHFMEKMACETTSCRCYQDVYDEVNERIRKQELEALSRSVNDELLRSLLKVRLFGYQLEGVKFAFRNGRTIIADEMGLGKTIQAIGTAELLRHFKLATSVLIVCPTSLKYQWKHEIEKFTNSTVMVIEGNAIKRKEIYRYDDSFYKIVSYNSLANDIKYGTEITTDMLVMDEVQRLKNWDTQIAKAARRVRSSYATLLSGTPLENKLEELYSIVELVDQYALSPYYKFRDEYIVTDNAGMTVGYRNLNNIIPRLNKTLIRRRKRDVAMQMPERMDKTLYVPMTKEQKAIHNEFEFHVSILVHKWRKFHFLSEQDRLRLIMLLGQMRMVANSTFILDQKSRHDTKVDEVVNILQEIFASGDEKVVIFSGWERMTRLIAAELDRMGITYSNLNGSVPSAKRKNLVEDFTNNPENRVFLSTDAGATGLNLQAGSIIINIELPWNPAVHEQRIGRIYRLGQQRNIQVINMVSEDSIEIDIQSKLKFKTAVAAGILDDGNDSVFLPKKNLDELVETLDKIYEDKEKAASVGSVGSVDSAASAASVGFADSVSSADSTGSVDSANFADSVDSAGSDDNDEPIAETQPNTFADADKTDTNKQPESAADNHPRENAPQSHSDASSASEGSNPQPTANTATEPRENASQSHSNASSASDGRNSQPTTNAASESRKNVSIDVPQQPDELVKQGISFLTGLAETLKSPERTRALVDQIVKQDEKTGQTTLQIPVASKETVANVLTLFSALLSKS